MLNTLLAARCTLPNGVVVVNTTPHPLSFMHDESEDQCFTVPSSPGCIVNARPQEVEVGKQDQVTFVGVQFEKDADTATAIAELLTEQPEVIIIGSMIAAQAYPGQVCAMVAAPGYERVPPTEKRMRMDRFTRF